MAIYQLTGKSISPIAPATFAELGVTERGDLQRLLRDQIEIVSPDTMVVSEEFGDWAESRRRIDLLGIDKNANLVVIELKRTEDGGHMELQAVRYAAMISTLTFDRVVEIFESYLQKRGDDRNGRESLLEFLGWEEPNEEEFASDIRIVLASAEFSKELTTAVIWLTERDIDITCVRIKPYGDRSNVLLDVQQVIPLPEAEDYQIRVREKKQADRNARKSSRDLTRFDVRIGDATESDLPKRRAILAVVRALCERGVTPEQIAEVISWKRMENLFVEVPGNVSNEQAIEELGSRYDLVRWFHADDELIQSHGSTFAFTNQWGNRTNSAMKLLLEKFTFEDVEFQRSSPD